MHLREVIDHPRDLAKIVGQARAAMTEHQRDTGTLRNRPEHGARHLDRLNDVH